MVSHTLASRTHLLSGVALLGLALVAAPARADSSNESETASGSAPFASTQTASVDAPIEERQSYAVRMMAQVYDGDEDLSHTQLLGIGRARKGNRSVTQFDYGDGAVVVTPDEGRMAASKFMNVTPTEKVVVYNYDSKTVQGDGELARFHNEIVRQFLGKGPKLGRDAAWTATIPLSTFGLAAGAETEAAIELSRTYFTHDRKPMVLIEYAIPAFSYSGDDGGTLIQWGRGFAVTDPGFGMIYFNAALHRAVESRPGAPARPYRFARNMVAANPDGSAMLDYREIEQLRGKIDPVMGAEAMRVVPVDDGGLPANEVPLELARNLDVLALSIAEDGANQLGHGSAAQSSNDRGTDTNGKGSGSIKILGRDTTAVTIVGLLGSWATMSPAEQEQAATTVKAGLEELNRSQQALNNSLQSAIQKQEAARKALENAPLVPASIIKERGEYVNSRWNNLFDETAALDVRQAEFDEAVRRAADLGEVEANTILSRARANLNAAKTRTDLAQKELTRAMEAYEKTAANARNYVPDAALEAELKAASKQVTNLQDEVVRFAQEASLVDDALAKAPQAAKSSVSSKLAKGFFFLGNGINAYTTVSSAKNFKNVMSQGNLGTGKNLKLSRITISDTTAGTIGWNTLTIALDIAGIATAAYSGDYVTAWSTAVAVTTGSVTDLIIAVKGWEDAQDEVIKATDGFLDTNRRWIEQTNRKLAKAEADLAVMDALLLEAEQDLDDLKDFKRRVEENRRRILAERERRRREREANKPPPPPQPEPQPTQRAEKRPLPPIDTSRNYPTRDERVPVVKKDDREYTGPLSTKLPQYILDDIEREKRRAAAQEWLDEYQRQKLAQLKEEERRRREQPGSYEFRTSKLETSELLVSRFDIDPVVFKPPIWNPPVFDEDGDLFVINEDGTTSLRKVGPDDFEITPFDAPEISKFPPTDPDDLDGYPGTGEYPAFGFDNLSGTVETDLSKWDEWLATQDIRKLTQLALAAGYPNLASALADAENIIRLSQDSGYRAWANRAPSCAGYVGCGPSYLGRWTMKRSIVALGDILADSRGIFSTGGLTDIGISGFDLMYALADFGLEDGDVISVRITQFGRVVDQLNGIVLTNNGSSFNARLNRGVAQMVITALNEGAVSPNTAAVSIQNVVNGDGSQAYSLGTGETAVLRIEANATPNGNNGSASNSTGGTRPTTGTTASSPAPRAAPRSNRALPRQQVPARSRELGDPTKALPEPGRRAPVRQSVAPRMGTVSPR